MSFRGTRYSVLSPVMLPEFCLQFYGNLAMQTLICNKLQRYIKTFQICSTFGYCLVQGTWKHLYYFRLALKRDLLCFLRMQLLKLPTNLQARDCFIQITSGNKLNFGHEIHHVTIPYALQRCRVQRFKCTISLCAR